MKGHFLVVLVGSSSLDYPTDEKVTLARHRCIAKFYEICNLIRLIVIKSIFLYEINEILFYNCMRRITGSTLADANSERSYDCRE